MMPTEQLAQYEEKLRAAGQFVTVQRRALLHYLVRTRTHPSTAEITRAVFDGKKASVATVYNTLRLLQNLRLLQVVQGPDGETRWDIRTDKHHHRHCPACDRIFDVDASDIEVCIAQPALACQVTEAHVWLSGPCNRCAQPGFPRDSP